MMIQNKNVPALRFPEFNDEWQSKKLSEIASIYDGTHQTPKYVTEGIKFVSVENIQDIENTKKFISKEAFEKDFKVKPQTDDILMTRITAGIIGATAIVPNDNPLAYYVSLALIRSKKGADVKFLSQRINSHQFKHELHKRIIHVAFPKKINLGEIGECKASLPTLPEQQKIAAFLTAVDEKIQQLAKKKNLWGQYKKGVMQRIFNQEIRFKDDKGNDFADWEEITLGELCNITTGKLDANAMKEDGEYRFYTCAKDYFKIDKFAFDTEALLVSGNGANVGYIHYYNGKFNAYQRTYVLDKFSSNIIYTKYFLEKFLSLRIDKEKNEGNTPYIVLGTLKDMTIYLPEEPEQRKIADFFSAIDEKINLVNKQLEKTQTFKKGLLQQMFI